MEVKYILTHYAKNAKNSGSIVIEKSKLIELLKHNNLSQNNLSENELFLDETDTTTNENFNTSLSLCLGNCKNCRHLEGYYNNMKYCNLKIKEGWIKLTK